MTSNGNGRIRGVILDYGEVVCRRASPETWERMAAALEIQPEAFLARWAKDRDAYDRGDLTPEEYWSRLLPAGRPMTAELLADLRKMDVDMWSDIDPRMTGWLEELRAAGFKTAVLSNMHLDMAAHVRRVFPWLKDLDYVLLSAEVRLLKPEPAIYLKCVEGLGLRPEETCFLDDREVNVRGAREAGLKAIRFETADSVGRELASLGIPAIPREASECAK